jgi:hypothetical protein
MSFVVLHPHYTISLLFLYIYLYIF